MRIRLNKFVSIFLVAALLLLPVRYALATSSMVFHSSGMEMTQDIDRSPYHATHADMDMEAVITNKEKTKGPVLATPLAAEVARAVLISIWG